MKKVLVLYSRPSINYPHILTDDEEMEYNAFLISKILASNNIEYYILGLQKDLKLLKRWCKKGKWIVFNLCEHLNGDYRKEYLVARYLERNKINFTGNTSYALKVAQNKMEFKKILRRQNLPVLLCKVFTKKDKNLDLSFKFPVIVKPLYQDGSSGLNENSIVKNKRSLKNQLEFIFENFNEPAIVEPFLCGREFNVAVIGRKKKMALPISEIDYSELPSSIPKILTYDAKWSKNKIAYKLTKPICPAKISKELEKKLKSIALKAGALLKCRDYYRVDFRTDEKGNPFILEVNPNPDISPDAGLARACKAKGIEYEDFILRLVKWAS